MTPRQKAISEIAALIVLGEMETFFKQKELPNSDRFFEGFLAENPSLKKLWGELNKQVLIQRKDLAKRFEADK